MFITVTCPKCGRSIKAKKKFVLNTGGVPCLKCKVRIPVSKEQVNAESEAAPPESAAPEPTAEPIASPAPPEDVPAVQAVAEPASMPEPPPAAPAAAAEPEEEEPLVVTPVIADAAADLESATQEIPAADITGPQIAFTCPHCQTAYPLRKSLAGKKIRCKGCARIVKVAPDSPVIPGTDPAAPPPPDDDIPVAYSPAETPPAAPPPPSPNPESGMSAPLPMPLESECGQPVVKKNTTQLRTALSGAEDRASTAEEMIQQLVRDKAASELSAARKIRELDGQIRELTARLNVRDKEEAARKDDGMMKRAEVENLLKNLCEALDANLQQEIAVHKNLVDDLKSQLTQALQNP